MKKLIPALCMLLVAACLMGTSTYAWFSANKAVTAEGMQVKAVSTGGLLIASYNPGGTAGQLPAASDFVTAASVKWTNAMKSTDDGVTYNAALNPASWNGTTWVTGASAKGETYEVNDDGYVEVTTNPQNYYLLSKWVIKTLDETGANHQIAVTKIELTGASNAGSTDALFEKSLRVMIVNGTTRTKFAPNYAAPTDGSTLTFNCAGEVGTKVAATDSVVPCAGTTISQVVGVANNAGDDTFEVYIYFEGEDPNCKTMNIETLKNISVKISFTDLTAE